MIPPPPPAIVLHVEPIDRGFFLSALGQEESGLDLNKVGALGERGPWQIRKKVWDSYVDEKKTPFEECAHIPETSAYVARCHFDWLSGRLKAHGLPLTPENVAATWLLGLAGGVRAINEGRIPEVAVRVGNLYRASLAVAPLKIERPR